MSFDDLPLKQQVELVSRKSGFQMSDVIFNNDGSICVNDVVNMSNQQWLEIPFKFSTVLGGFNISINPITSLVGSPRLIGGGNFRARNTKITNLTGGPTGVGGDYVVNDNFTLTSLRGVAREIEGKLNILNCPNLIGYECRFALLSNIGEYVAVENPTLAIVLNEGRENGVIPSELIPGKIRQLKEYDEKKRAQ